MLENFKFIKKKVIMNPWPPRINCQALTTITNTYVVFWKILK